MLCKDAVHSLESLGLERFWWRKFVLKDWFEILLLNLGMVADAVPEQDSNVVFESTIFLACNFTLMLRNDQHL